MLNSQLYRLLRWNYRLLGRIYCTLRYYVLETSHSISARFSRHTGVTAIKRNPELIVSLTTIPERIGTIHLCLDSLLKQSLKPDRLILWLSESNDTDRPKIDKETLPASLLRLVARGVEIRWCKDIRSYRKIIPTLLDHPDALIVTADDDIFYSTHWLRTLYDAYQIEPQYLHCHRAHLIRYAQSGEVLPYRKWGWLAEDYQGPSYDLLPTGGSGVLYAPGQLHSEVLNETIFLELCPKADDVWMKAMTLLTGVPCKKVKRKSLKIIEIRIPNNRTLWSENVIKDLNDLQIAAVSTRYGVFRRA